MGLPLQTPIDSYHGFQSHMTPSMFTLPPSPPPVILNARFLDPPVFRGFRYRDYAAQFLINYEKFTAAYHDRQKVLSFKAHLENDAFYWFNLLEKQLKLERYIDETTGFIWSRWDSIKWKDIRIEFKSHFSEHVATTIRKMTQNSDEFGVPYIQRFMYELIENDHFLSNDLDRIACITEGMNDHYKNKLIGKEFESIDEFIIFVRRIDLRLHRQKPLEPTDNYTLCAKIERTLSISDEVQDNIPFNDKNSFNLQEISPSSQLFDLPPKTKSNRVCYKCRKKGHLASICQQNSD